jgi:hypothetical protein
MTSRPRTPADSSRSCALAASASGYVPATRRVSFPDAASAPSRPRHRSLGDSLMPAVNAIKTWAEGHIDEIKASRAEYDGRTAAGPNP